MTAYPIELFAELSDYLGLAAAVFFPLELVRRWRKKQLTRAVFKEMLASVFPLLPTILVGGLVLSFIGGIYGLAANYQLTSVPSNALSALCCVILVDFLYYVDHYCGHRVRAYWAISHSVHHSSPQYDQTTAARISFVDGFISPWFYLPAVLIGFDPLLVLACFGFILAYQQWIHTETIDKLVWLDPWLNTPSNHRVHHSSQPQYLDKNYGAVLMIWDRMFGTYAPERDTVVFGITQPINSCNPIAVHFAELMRLWRDLRAEPRWSVRFALLVQPPGWAAKAKL